MRHALLVLLATLVLSLTGSTVFAAAKSFMPGGDKSLGWKMQDFNKSIQSGKPILIYVYDPFKNNSLAGELEKEVFPSTDVKAAFAEFLPIKMSISERSWPPVIVQQGVKGAALIIMTCDGKVFRMFGRGSMPKCVREGKNRTYPDLVATAQAAVKQNEKAQEYVKKNPPPKYTPPGQSVAVGKKPEEEEPPPQNVEGLLAGEGGKKANGPGAGTKKAPKDKVPGDETE